MIQLKDGEKGKGGWAERDGGRDAARETETDRETETERGARTKKSETLAYKEIKTPEKQRDDGEQSGRGDGTRGGSYRRSRAGVEGDGKEEGRKQNQTGKAGREVDLLCHHKHQFLHPPVDQRAGHIITAH